MSGPQSGEVCPLEQREEGGAVGGPAPSSPSVGQALGLAGAVVSLLAAVVACGCGPLLALFSLSPGTAPLNGAIVQQSLAVTVLGVGLGLLAAVECWRVWRGRPSPPFHPRRVGLLWLLALPLLVLGVAVSLVASLSTTLLPLVNTAAMALLPALVLGTVGGVLGGRGGTWRDVVGGLIGGASLGPALAITVEIAVVASLVVIALLFGLLPGGVERLESLQVQMSDPSFLADPQALLDLLSPAVVVIILFVFAVVTPLTEEIVKTLAVGLAGPWLRPTPARAFLLGVAAGAGFALTENLLNGALIGDVWGLGLVSRLAATLMHCATGGLMGWGWGQAWTARRPARLALAFVGAGTVHGLWNGLAVGITLSGLSVGASMDNPLQMGAAGLLMMALLAGLGLMCLGTVVGLLWAGRALGRRHSS